MNLYGFLTLFVIFLIGAYVGTKFPSTNLIAKVVS